MRPHSIACQSSKVTKLTQDAPNSSQKKTNANEDEDDDL